MTSLGTPSSPDRARHLCLLDMIPSPPNGTRSPPPDAMSSRCPNNVTAPQHDLILALRPRARAVTSRGVDRRSHWWMKSISRASHVRRTPSQRRGESLHWYALRPRESISLIPLRAQCPARLANAPGSLFQRFDTYGSRRTYALLKAGRGECGWRQARGIEEVRKIWEEFGNVLTYCLD